MRNNRSNQMASNSRCYQQQINICYSFKLFYILFLWLFLIILLLVMLFTIVNYYRWKYKPMTTRHVKQIPSSPTFKILEYQIPCFYNKASSPTPGALVLVSYEHFINLKRQDKIDKLQIPDQPQCTSSESREKTIKELITSICKYQKIFRWVV